MEIEEFKKIKVIKEFSDFIVKKNYSVHTYESYISDLYYFHLFVKKDLLTVNEEDIRDYLEYLNLKQGKASSVRRRISTFKTFYKFFQKI